MRTFYSSIIVATLMLTMMLTTREALASHAQSADITYTCVGGNTFKFRLAFYRDCAGVAAPNSVSLNFSSFNCNQNFSAVLQRIPNTGNDITPICPTMTTQCNGGTYPGVQEWVYEGNVTMPAQCSDWIISFTLCCRNNAISTINNPGGENIYVEARLDNLNFVCNSSPQFSNKPVPFICVGQNYCFNHGAVDPDGDSLVYALIPPATSATTNVSYLPGYSSTQPLLSNPATTIDTETGDICMFPQQLEVTVMAVRVREYRGGEMVGSVVRDIQVRVIPCTNTNPYISGINGTNSFSASACAGSNLSFQIFSYDNDPGQNLSLTWNNAISGASFTTTNAQHPTGTFSWTPTAADVSTLPYCFTVTVTDDNCPLNGTQTYSFCITVTGFNVNATSTPASCGLTNGTTSVSVSGGNAPYTYAWSSGQTTANVNGISAGVYTVNVSDAAGCMMTDSVTVQQGAAPANVQMSTTAVSCFGGNNGSANATVTGGQAPYTYLWSNGTNGTSISNVTSGNYTLTVTTANGCVTQGTVNVAQPSAPLTVNIATNSVTCNGGNNGSATAIPSGGTAPYSYSWNTTPLQSTATANGLIAGLYHLTVNDANNCSISTNVNILQPQAITLTQLNTTPVSCYGGTNGSASIQCNGGTGALSYSWNTTPVITTSGANNLAAGNYNVIVTDANGCSNTFPVNITQPTPLQVNITSSTNVSCFNQNNGTANASANGGNGNYTWHWNSMPQQYASNATGLDGGTYTVTVYDANNCTATDTVTIIEPPMLTITTGGSDTICPGYFTTIFASASGGTGNIAYNWNNGLPNASSLQVSPGATTTYQVSASDANGCVANGQPITITVNNINLVDLIVDATPQICEGQAGIVTASIHGGIGTYQITWNNNLPSSFGPFTVYPDTSGYYTATLTDVCNNQITESDWMEVHPLPLVQLTPQSATACGSATLAFFNDLSNAPGSDFAWSFGDGATSSSEIIAHTYSQSGNYLVILQVTSTYGCVNADSTNVAITVNPRAVADFSTNMNEVSEFNPTVNFFNTSTNTSSVQWFFGDGNGSTTFNPSHEYSGTGTYNVTLIANNAFNCPDTATQEIIVRPEFTFYIPNAFTPDGDGKNDVFNGKGTNIAEYEMLIFNRWGELVFSTNSLDYSWDGTYKASTEPLIDVYVYKVKIKDSVRGQYHLYEGHVTIVR
jgi:gliding motility-associated-like protein